MVVFYVLYGLWVMVMVVFKLKHLEISSYSEHQLLPFVNITSKTNIIIAKSPNLLSSRYGYGYGHDYGYDLLCCQI